MNTKKVLALVFSLIFIQACNETSSPDLDQTHDPLTCLSFVDTSIGIYAMTHWDIDHNGCLSESEAALVTALPANAFAGNLSLLSISDLNKFPNLTVIGSGAFSGCTGLVTADLPNIKTVGDKAFSGCTGLVSVRLPNASDISDDAFEGCTSLTNIVGPVTLNTCTGGALKCSDDSSQVLICMNNKWMTKETCANGCANSICIGNIPVLTCTKGTLKCSDDQTQVMLCKTTHGSRWHHAQTAAQTAYVSHRLPRKFARKARSNALICSRSSASMTSG